MYGPTYLPTSLSLSLSLFARTIPSYLVPASLPNAISSRPFISIFSSSPAHEAASNPTSYISVYPIPSLPSRLATATS